MASGEGRKLTKGKQKIEMKLIENEDDRLISFSKRKSGVLNKASELVTLCGAEVGILVFSPAGKPFTFGHPSFDSVANRFMNRNSTACDLVADRHQQDRLNELNQQHNLLISQLELETERGNALRQLKKEHGGVPGWWEARLEELVPEELHQVKASLAEFQNNLLNHLQVRGVSPFPFSPFYSGQGTTSLSIADQNNAFHGNPFIVAANDPFPTSDETNPFLSADSDTSFAGGAKDNNSCPSCAAFPIS